MIQPKKLDTADQQRAFLQALSETGIVTRACEMAGIPRQTVYSWRRDDPNFMPLWDAARELGIDALEDEALRRAKEGVERPVFQGGKEVGRIREFSDTLLIFALKGARPEKYRDRVSTEIWGRLTLEQLVLGAAKRPAGSELPVPAEAAAPPVDPAA